MTAVFSNQKKLTLKIDTPLYSVLEKQADETGVELNDFIQQLLTNAMEEWDCYCQTLQNLSSEDKSPFHVCLK